MGDIYCIFYEKAVQLLKQDGTLCFITSNKWMRAGYGEKTRQLLSEKTNPIKLIDFAGTKVFESATVDVNILLAKKQKNNQKTLACIIKDNCTENLSDYIKQNSTEISFTNSENWVIFNPIELSIKKKIEQYGTKLQDWDLSINRGILTGYNDAFIIDEATKNSLITADPKSAELIRPILRGKDIRKYSYIFNNLWVIFVPCGFTKLNCNNKNPENWFRINYSSIYNYLVNIENKLSKKRNRKSKGLYNRDDQGDFWWELRSCKYLDDFNKQKIIYPETTQGAYFALDNDKFVIDKTCFMITGSNRPYYLLATLCSSLFEFAYKRIFSSIELGSKGYQYNKHALIKLPIINESFIPKEILDEIEQLICNNQYMHNNHQIFERIDQIIFKLYSITPEEINYIKMSKE